MLGRDVAHDFIGKRTTAGKPPAQSFDKPIVAFAAFRLRRRLRRVWQRRRAGEPKADKERDGFIGDGDMAFETFDLPCHAIETPRQCGLQTVCTVRRQKRSKRRFHHQRLGDSLAMGVIGEPDREVGRQAERMLGAHGSKVHVIAGIERHLPREPAGPTLQGLKVL